MKDILIISLFSLYNNDKQLSIKYFKIQIFEIFHNNILNSFKSYLYNNNYLSLISNFYSKEENSKDGKHFNSLILFGYPNITNTKVDIINRLFNENEIIVDLYNGITIENNIFDYEIEGILIKRFNCDGFKLISNKTGIELKGNNINLVLNEKINVLFSNNNYNKKFCSIEYNVKVKDLSFNNINTYINKINNTYEDNNEKNNYITLSNIERNGYYNLS